MSLKNQRDKKAVSDQLEDNMAIKFGDEFEEIKHEFAQEQAEAAMRDCIQHYHKQYLPYSMQLKGLYDSLITVGFDVNQATMLTMAQLQSQNHEN